jgi:hypothetical protein
MTMKRRLAQENLRILPGLLAERSGGGFAGSPDVPTSALGPRIVHSLHAGYRVECETSGLAALAGAPATAPAATTASATSRRLGKIRSFSAQAHKTKAAGNHPANGFPGVRMPLERTVLHALDNLNPDRQFIRMLWDRFVDVGGHRRENTGSK